MRSTPQDAYKFALSDGQKYYKNAVNRGEFPYPPVLDYIVSPEDVVGYVDLGLVNVPLDRLIGTKTLGRSHALAGNFMPLLGNDSEFAAKWTDLYTYQTGDEGIRDPIKCYEYLGRFYVEEGNKRVSVLKYVQASAVLGRVTRVVPRYTEDPERRAYYEFMWFYSLTKLYEVELRRPGDYARLLAALGCAPDHEWTTEERRSFSAAFARFREIFEKQKKPELDATPGEGLLVWLQLFDFAGLRSRSREQLETALNGIWPDIVLHVAPKPADLYTAPPSGGEEPRCFLDRLLGIGRVEHLNVAFLYSNEPGESAWAESHELGRNYLAERLGDRVSTRAYVVPRGDVDATLRRALDEGAEVVFATDPGMAADCRRFAALNRNVKFLVCGLSLPYAGVRFYFSRIYEAEFIAGAVAGAMTDRAEVGYLANLPFCGVPAEINAFALGLRMTNHKARLRVVWACEEGDPMAELRERGVEIVCNQLVPRPEGRPLYQRGTWLIDENRTLRLTDIVWHWGKLYEQIILSIFSGLWNSSEPGKAVSYWWGLDSGVVEFRLGEALPEGVRFMAEMMKDSLIHGAVSPFRCHIEDRDRVLRNDGTAEFSPEELIGMTWFCDNVLCTIPPYDALRPEDRKLVRLLGLYREHLPPELENTDP